MMMMNYVWNNGPANVYVDICWLIDSCLSCRCILFLLLGGVAMVACWTSNGEVTGLTLVWLKTLGKLFTRMFLFTKQYNSVPVKGWRRFAAGKVSVGLASHWPCVRDSVVYPFTRSMAIEREITHCLSPFFGMAPFIFLPFCSNAAKLVRAEPCHLVIEDNVSRTGRVDVARRMTTPLMLVHPTYLRWANLQPHPRTTTDIDCVIGNG